MKTIKTAAIYVRVSTDKQEELSPDAQKRLLLNYAKSHNYIVNNECIFIENGISGRKAEKRPEFQRMIAMSKSKEKPFDIILVWKYSRFARNQEESIVYKSMLKKQNNIDVVSISEPLIDGPFGSLIERIIEWMDEYYSIRLSGEVVRGMTEKAIRGGYQSIPPMGYLYQGKGVPPVIDPKNADVVKLIFHKYNNGAECGSIARYLNEHGFCTRRGSKFENRVVKYILENPFYIGKVRWNRGKHGSFQQNSEADIIIADGVHEPLISVEDFKLANERLKNEFKPLKRRNISACKHWLSGLVKCPICGKTMAFNSYSNNKSAVPHFNCIGYNKGVHNGSNYVREDKLIQGVVDALYQSQNSSYIEFEHLKTSSADSSAIRNLKSELGKIDLKLYRVKEAYRNGIDTLEEYKENKKIIEDQKNDLENKLATLTKKKSNIVDLDIRSRIASVLDIIQNNESNNEEKGNAIRSIVKKIVYDKKTDSLKIFYYL